VPDPVGVTEPVGVDERVIVVEPVPESEPVFDELAPVVTDAVGERETDGKDSLSSLVSSTTWP
jgi:hypothetical protein